MVNNQSTHFFYRGPVSFTLGWTMVVFIIIFSLLPGSSLPKFSWDALFGIDKWAHFICYGWSCIFLLIYYVNYTKLNYIGVNIPLALFLMGGLIEFLQAFLKGGRTFDLLDQLANTLGILGGMFLARYVNRKLIKQF